MLIAAELEEGMRLNTANVKQLCSTDEIYAEKKYKEGSFLEELDGLNVEVRIKQTLADSIDYTVLKRCGMEESELAEEICFLYIHEFNSSVIKHLEEMIESLRK